MRERDNRLTQPIHQVINQLKELNFVKRIGKKKVIQRSTFNEENRCKQFQGINQTRERRKMYPRTNSFQSNGLQPARFFCPWNFPGKNTGVGSCFLLQQIFPTQGSNPALLHYRQILYQLSQQGSPEMSVRCPRNCKPYLHPLEWSEYQTRGKVPGK